VDPYFPRLLLSTFELSEHPHWTGPTVFTGVNETILCAYHETVGARVSLVVKALRYKPAGRGFDSRWCHWNFSVT